MTEPITIKSESCRSICAAWGTWIGRLKDSNQDAAVICLDGGFLVVSDGMGSTVAGEMAARMVVRRLPDMAAYHLRYDADPSDDDAVQTALKDAVMELNHAVRDEGSRMPGIEGAGATVVAARIDASGELWVVHMGDSRAYMLRQRELRQLTEDHSLINSLIKRGVVSREEETALLEHRGKLTRYVGMGGGARADVTRQALAPGDRLLLCTDGLTQVVPDERIARILTHPGGPVDACRALLEAARLEGSMDNTTALVAEWQG